MKSKDLKELKSKSIEALKKEIVRLVGEKNESKIERDVAKSKNVHKILKIKREIAQIKTILAMKQFLEKTKKEQINVSN